MKQLLLLASLALIACPASAQNYDGMARKMTHKAQKIGRQAERMGKKAGKENCTRQMTSADIEKSLRDCKGLLKDLPEKVSYNLASGIGNAGGLSGDAKRKIANLPTDTRKEIRRALKKLPAKVRKMPVIRTLNDVIRHPKKYRDADSK